MAQYAVSNCDNTVLCDTLEQACRTAEEWFQEGWEVKLNPAWGVGAINGELRRAFGPEGHDEPTCPVISRRA